MDEPVSGLLSEEEATSILSRVAQSASKDSKVYIMETLWDRQPYETGSYCLTQISLYFTAMANGNSKMFHSDDLIRCIKMPDWKWKRFMIT